MRIYEHSNTAWFCGHWNASPIEIGVTPLLRAVPDGEVHHHHDYCEYYVVLEGSAELEVEGRAVPLRADTVVMVEAGERHRVVSVGSSGVRWVIVKQRSEPNSKHIS
jgi:mannose-6-phosphate isomerase-like protein (cupin superfamily)